MLEMNNANPGDSQAPSSEESGNLTRVASTEIQKGNLQKAKVAWSFFSTYVAVPLYMLITLTGASHSQSSVATSGPTEDSCPTLTTQTPLSSAWKLALSLTPFLLVINGILGLNYSSHKVAPTVLLITVMIGLTFFDGYGWLEKYDSVTTTGVVFLTIYERILWTVLDYAFNVFAAFVFLEMVERWGVMRSMQDEFEVLADNPTKKITLVLFCFAIIIAVVAPGGSNFLIAGSIMIRMNIGHETSEKGKLDQGRRIAAICLFGNGLTSAFNLVGVCIIAIAEDILELVARAGVSRPCDDYDLNCAKRQIGFHFSIQFLIFCVFSPLLFVFIFTKSFNAEVRAALPLLLGCGTVYGGVQLLTALYIGPELPCLTAAGCALLFYMAYEFLPGKIRSMRGQETVLPPRQMSFREAWRKNSFVRPFLLMIVLLFIVRTGPGVEKFLQGGDSTSAQRALNPVFLEVMTQCDIKWRRTFPWLSHSGMIVIWCALLTPVLVPYRDSKRGEGTEKRSSMIAPPLRRSRSRYDLNMPRASEGENFKLQFFKVVKTSFFMAFMESKNILVSIASYSALAKVMSGFGMTQAIAQALVDIFSSHPSGFSIVAPAIGFLGSGLTGSTTTSNFLFGQLQVETALELELVTPEKGSAWAVAGVQILGSSAGELVSPLNAVFAGVLLNGAIPESDTIKQVLWIFAGWMGMCMFVSYLALVAFDDVY